MATVLVSVSDPVLLDGVHALVAAGVARGEALGFVDPPAPDDYRRSLAALLDRSATVNGGVFAAIRDGRVVGTAQWSRSRYPTRRGLAELDRVAVAPDARRGGIGREVVEAVVADAAAHGIEVLVLEVRGDNHGAIALYERCAFSRCGRIPNAVSVGSSRYDLVLMARELPRSVVGR
jgi:ribosomal protein S18 acetylase RimI-like enzyme